MGNRHRMGRPTPQNLETVIQPPPQTHLTSYRPLFWCWCCASSCRYVAGHSSFVLRVMVPLLASGFALVVHFGVDGVFGEDFSAASFDGEGVGS